MKMCNLDTELACKADDEPTDGELAFWELSRWRVEEPEVSYRAGDEEGGGKVYDLAERTARFGEAIIELAKKIPFNPVNNRLIDQLVGTGTSIGANYCEADDNISTPDFKHRISICRKESKETRYWLRMIAKAEPSHKDAARRLWKEVTELNRIFGAIWRRVGKSETRNQKSEPTAS